MAYRYFVDDKGTRWEVWDIQPQMVERRSGTDRRLRNAGADDWGDDPPVMDRRRIRDRRTLGRTRPAPRVNLGSEMARGWLAFESPTERRRLCPIPDRWEQASADELLDFCRRATGRPKLSLA